MTKLHEIRKYLIQGKLFIHAKKKRFNKIEKFIKQIDAALGLVARQVIYRHGDIKNNKIFMMTYDGKYSCNLRYITDEILERNLPVEITWVAPADGEISEDAFPEQVNVVRRGSFEMYEEMAQSKIWFDNALNCVWFGMPKKKGQIYFNTWHGSMGIKRLSGNFKWRMRAKQCNRFTDYCISNSIFEENVYRDTFWPDVTLLKYGHARNDVFFNPEKCSELQKRAKEYFSLDADTKLFLYAPTFRDNGKQDYESVDYLALKKMLEARFGGKWVILVRSHFKDRKRKKELVTSEWLKDASDYGDMQELLPAIDAGMTDYSSWAYDYVLTRRPIFLYAPDVAEYDQTRGFYFSLESTRFPLAHNNIELLEAVKNFDDVEYQKNVTVFLKEKGCYEDGGASKRIVDKIVEVLHS